MRESVCACVCARLLPLYLLVLPTKQCNTEKKRIMRPKTASRIRAARAPGAGRAREGEKKGTRYAWMVGCVCSTPPRASSACLPFFPVFSNWVKSALFFLLYEPGLCVCDWNLAQWIQVRTYIHLLVVEVLEVSGGLI